MDTKNLIENAITIIDAERRRIYGNVNHAKGEVSEMYWEGVCTGLEYAQNYLEKLSKVFK